MPATPAHSAARIFVSCGQSKNSDEVEIVAGIEAELKLLGFEPWIAEFVFDAPKNSG